MAFVKSWEEKCVQKSLEKLNMKICLLTGASDNTCKP